MKIVYIFADNAKEWNSSEWRCAVPARALNQRAGHQAVLVSMAEFAGDAPAAVAACQDAHVIVVQRNLFGPVLAAMLRWKARDKVIVADFDDAYDLMPASNPSYAFWNEGRWPVNGQLEKLDPAPLTQFRSGLRLSHGATVPSKRLADDWNAYTDVHYLPNYIDLTHFRDVVAMPHGGLNIGWGGSLSHLQSFSGSGILAALKRVCRARPQVKVVIHGSDRRIFKQLPLPPSQKVLLPWVPYAQWPRQLAQVDIGLAPLHGAYDDRRSWIKVLEYLVMKIPWVASDGPAYDELRGCGWLVKNTPAAWERVLLDMVDHYDDYRAEAGCAPYLFGLSQAIDANLDKVLATYEQIAAHAAPERAHVVH